MYVCIYVYIYISRFPQFAPRKTMANFASAKVIAPRRSDKDLSSKLRLMGACTVPSGND